MGLLQALVKGERLEHIDYLSTVSGGGYTGTSLTWFLSRGLPDGSPAGTTEDDFPFGARVTAPGDERARGRNAILDYVRQHANYLTPTPSLNVQSLVAVVLRSAFVSVFVHFSLLTAVMGALLWMGAFDPVPRSALGNWGLLVKYLSTPPLLMGGLLVLALAWASLSYSVAMRVWKGASAYVTRTSIQAGIGLMTSGAFVLMVLGVLPVVYVFIESRVGSSWAAGSASTMVGVVLGVIEGRKQVQDQSSPGLVAKLRPIVGVALVLYGLLLAAFAASDWLLNGLGNPWPAFLLGVVGLVFGWASNVNYLGAHRMYRDRLMELFTPDPATVVAQRWDYARLADPTRLSDLCGVPEKVCRRPYHLINANVVLVGSRACALRARGGDSFLLSPLYSGSAATGWRRTSTWAHAGWRGMTLPTAMAISGAAVNPNTGVAGRGVTRNRMVSMLLSLLNLRLGYWAPNPAFDRARTPNFISPGLRSGMLGLGLSEHADLVELSDGGHFENLGVYELLRRKAGFIIVSDGAADPKYEFGDLANLVERARVDFGAKIEFDPEYPLSDLIPGSGPAQPDALDAKYRLAKRAFALGTIHYRYGHSEMPRGKIVYIKTTMIPALPADVTSYKATHPEFPDESTSDQFFDEAQFEAYRELGYRAGCQWLEHEEDFVSDETQAPESSGKRGRTAAEEVEAG